MILLIILIAVIIFTIYIAGLNTAFLILSCLLLGLIIYRGKLLYDKLNEQNKMKKELNILNVEKGGVLQLQGVGEISEDLTLKVLAKHLYREGDFYWHELECDNGNEEKVFIDVEVDDDVKVSIVLDKLQLSDLKLSSTLQKIDDDEAGYAEYKKTRYIYKESDKAVFYRYCDDKKSEKFYYWDFVNKNHTISVEKWDNKGYDVFYCQTLAKWQIKVLSNKEEVK